MVTKVTQLLRIYKLMSILHYYNLLLLSVILLLQLRCSDAFSPTALLKSMSISTTRKSAEPALRIGHGFDIHRLIEGTALVIGGVTIPHSKGAGTVSSSTHLAISTYFTQFSIS